MAITPNVDNLRAVLAQIEAHPETWKQSDWHCGTSHCFGGWAQVMAGCKADDATVRQDARRFLGITAYQADRLFSAGNSLDFLRAEVAWLCGPENGAGYDCDGYNRAGYDCDGYNRAGYDCDGYNRDGYNRAGYNRAGYDCDGYNRDGYNRDGYNRDGYNRDGYDCDGYDCDGLDANNNPRP